MSASGARFILTRDEKTLVSSGFFFSLTHSLPNLFFILFSRLLYNTTAPAEGRRRSSSRSGGVKKKPSQYHKNHRKNKNKTAPKWLFSLQFLMCRLDIQWLWLLHGNSRSVIEGVIRWGGLTSRPIRFLLLYPFGFLLCFQIEIVFLVFTFSHSFFYGGGEV